MRKMEKAYGRQRAITVLFNTSISSTRLIRKNLEMWSFMNYLRLFLPAALFLIFLAGPVAAADKSARKMRLAVDVRYYYGHWRWGEFKMTPRAGLAGPDVRLELFDGRWTIGTSYLSGNFSATGATALNDPRFHSRKNFDLEDNREEFEISLEFRPVNFAGLVVMYKLGQYDLEADVDLNSDQRLYGTGREEALNETRGWGVGLRPQLPVGRHLTFRGEFVYFPDLKAEGAGTHQYQMLFHDNELDERWFSRDELRGFKGRGELIYALPSVPVSLAVGYFYQRLVDRDSTREGWLENYLVSQTQTRSWLKDRFQGFTARAGFLF